MFWKSFPFFFLGLLHLINLTYEAEFKNYFPEALAP